MFKAIYLQRRDDVTHALLSELDEQTLPAGNVLIDVEYSSLNFKDALAITGRGAIVRSWPMVAGVDLAGVVSHSEDSAWTQGDRVVINCWGLSENHWGGLSQKARVSSDWLLKIPEGFSTKHAMGIGTAGYTAALCVRALLKHGLSPQSGPVVVTGATGGVGSIALALLSSLGFHVVAVTGRSSETTYLKELGANEIIDRLELSLPNKRSLQSERWAGAVDTVGSHTLANVIAATKFNGAVTACGLAQGADFPSSVIPFILRGVTLFGINCAFVPNEIRAEVWALLEKYLALEKLEGLMREIGLSDAIAVASDLLDGKTKGRIVVDVNR